MISCVISHRLVWSESIFTLAQLCSIKQTGYMYILGPLPRQIYLLRFYYAFLQEDAKQKTAS